MYVSQFSFEFRPEQFEQVNRMARQIVDELRQVPGCRQMVLLRTAPDTLASCVTYETLVHAEAAVPTIARFFERLGPLLTRLPHREIFPALIYEQF